VPNLAESPVLLYGTVVDVESVNDFESKKPDGARVLVTSAAPGAPGFSRVRVRLDDFRRLAQTTTPGKPVCWLVRHGAWAGRTNGGEVYVQYVRDATENDVQAAHEYLNASVRELAGAKS